MKLLTLTDEEAELLRVFLFEYAQDIRDDETDESEENYLFLLGMSDRLSTEDCTKHSQEWKDGYVYGKRVMAERMRTLINQAL